MKTSLGPLGFSRMVRVLSKVVKANFGIAARAVLARREEEAVEDRLPAAFQPDLMLPVQFYETMHGKNRLEGTKLLMFTVLEDAVENFMRYMNSPTRKGHKRFQEAQEWIEREDRQWLFSFDNVCEAVDIDPEYMRRGLRRWAQLERGKLKAVEHAAPA